MKFEKGKAIAVEAEIENNNWFICALTFNINA